MFRTSDAAWTSTKRSAPKSHGARGVLDGALVTENRRAAEKRRCVEAIRVRFPGVRLAAYGNARSDFDHLAVVEEPVLVNAGPALRREAENRGFRTEDWCNK